MRRTHYVCLGALMMAQTALLAWSAHVHSPTHLEVFHLPAGLSHLETSKHDLYRVNPPLVRKIAALPAYLLGAHCVYQLYSADPLLRAEYSVGIDTAYALGSRFVWLTSLGRWACIPLVLAGTWACFHWAAGIYRDVLAGYIAALLWTTSPYVLGHGSLLTPDAHAAALSVVASYLFWRWLQLPAWSEVPWLALVLGLAQLTKLTLLVFYPIWIFLWVVCRRPARPTERPSAIRELAKLLAVFAGSALVICGGYEWDGVLTRLGDFRFQTRTFTGIDSLDRVPQAGANRFVGTWLGRLPVPLPEDYVYGCDTQKRDFEAGFHSYLNGVWRERGWWHFHLTALLIKLPLGFLGLLVVTFAALFLSQNPALRWRDELQLLLPVVVILSLLVLNSGIGLHSRYALPILPFFYVWCGKLARPLRIGRKLPKIGILTLMTWSIVSSLFQFPHSTAYFNELVGGPANGYRYLAKSDSSWGQDLLYLKRWLERHPQAAPLHLAFAGPFDPRLAGIKFVPPPRAPRSAAHPATIPARNLGPQPGYYAIDVCFLLGGDRISCSDGQGNWYEPSTTPGYDLSYFLPLQPLAQAGYSLRIYHLTPDQANRLRHELRLPPLK